MAQKAVIKMRDLYSKQVEPRIETLLLSQSRPVTFPSTPNPIVASYTFHHNNIHNGFFSAAVTSKLYPQTLTKSCLTLSAQSSLPRFSQRSCIHIHTWLLTNQSGRYRRVTELLLHSNCRVHHFYKRGENLHVLSNLQIELIL